MVRSQGVPILRVNMLGLDKMHFLAQNYDILLTCISH